MIPGVDRGAARRALMALMQHRRTAFGHTVLATALIVGLGLLTSIQLARWLGPAGRGEVAAALLWPMMLAFLANFGLLVAIIYHAAQQDARPGAVFWTSAALGAVQGALAVGIGWIAIPWLLDSQRPEVIRAARVFLLVVPVSLITQYGQSTLQARHHFGSFNLNRLILPVGYLAGVIFLRRADRLDAWSVVLLQLGLNVAALLGVMIALAKHRLLSPSGTGPALARRLLGYGAKVYAGTASSQTNARIDQAYLGRWYPPAELGLYVAALSAASVLQVLSMGVHMVLTPRIAAEPLPAQRAATLQRVFRIYLRLSSASAVLLALMIPLAIPLVFGVEFEDAVAPGVVLVFAMLCHGAKEVLAGGAQGLGDPWLSSRAEIAGVVVTLVLVPLLLAPLGILGAALAVLLGNATQALLVARGLARSHGISRRSLLRAH